MKKQDAIENVLISSEVQEILKINRKRMSALVLAGKITPMKKFARESLFWLPDVLKLKAEMEKDSRTNLYKEMKKDA
jgi:hypothetical protein